MPRPTPKLTIDLTKLSKQDLIAQIAIEKWEHQALDHQRPPSDDDWYIWFLLAGRGAGKTLTASHWVLEQSILLPRSNGVVIAPTANDLRFTCFEGDSGLLNVIPHELIINYNKSLFELKLFNGTKIRGVSAEKPDRLRGMNTSWAWIDELAAAQYAQQVFEQLEFTLRKGKDPKIIITSTPRPIPLMVQLKKSYDKGDDSIRITQASSYDNPYLPQKFHDKISAYEGTTLGRQEIYAEIVEEGYAIFPLEDFSLWPPDVTLPRVKFLLDSWDTSSGEKDHADKSARIRFAIVEHPKTKKNVAIVVDVWEGVLKYPELRRTIIEAFDKPFQYYCADEDDKLISKKVDLVCVESASSGIAVIQDLARSKAIKVFGIPTRNLDKIQRANFVATLVELGMVYLFQTDEIDEVTNKYFELPRDEYYNSNFVDQVTNFPYQPMEMGLLSQRDEPFDDLVDAFTHGLTYLRGLFGDAWLHLDPIPFRERYEYYDKKPNPYAQ